MAARRAPLRQTDARGRLRFGFVPEIANQVNLDPASPNRHYDAIQFLYNRLVRHGEDGRPTPDLAESWESNPGADVWTFHLRSGVTFHDGKPLMAADVVATIRHILDPATLSPSAAVLAIVDAEAIETPDNRTIVIPLTQPHADFPTLMLHYSTYIIPEGGEAGIAESGVGTGPFLLEQFDTNGAVTLAANDDYWNGPPKLGAVEFVAFTGSEALVSALLADQIDTAREIGAIGSDLLAQDGRLLVQELPSGAWQCLAMRTDTPPFDDVRVRQAMKLVVDREAMIQGALAGRGAVAGDNPVWPGDPYAIQLPRPRDIEGARTLLAQAGYGDGLEVTLHTTSLDSLWTSMAVLYQQMAAEAGITIQIEQSPADSYFDEVWMKAPFCFDGWAERPCDQVLNEVFRGGANWNETFWANPAFDDLLDRARRELDFARRKTLYQEAQQLIAEEGGAVIPFFTNLLRPMHRRVTGIPATARYVDWAAVAIDPAV